MLKQGRFCCLRPLSHGQIVLDGSSELSLQPVVGSKRRAVQVFWDAGIIGNFSLVANLVVVMCAVKIGIGG